MAGILRRTAVAMVTAIPLTIALAWNAQAVALTLASLIPLAILVALVAIWFPRGRRTLAGIFYAFASPATIFIFAKLVFWPALVLLGVMLIAGAEESRNRAQIDQFFFGLFFGWVFIAWAKQQIWNKTILAGWKWAQADWKRQSDFVRATRHLPKDAIYREAGHHGLAIDTVNNCLVIIGRCLNVAGKDKDWTFRKIDFQDIDRYGAVRGGHGYDVMVVTGGLQGAVTGLMVGAHEAEIARMRNALDTGIDFTLTDNTQWRVQMPEQLHPHWIRLLQDVL